VGFVHRNTAYRLRHPQFSPERIRRQLVSIGNGGQVTAYRGLLGSTPMEWLTMQQKYAHLMTDAAGPSMSLEEKLELLHSLRRGELDDATAMLPVVEPAPPTG
jgi:hypothetical protein